MRTAGKYLRFISLLFLLTTSLVCAQTDTSDIFPVYKDSPFHENPDAKDETLPYSFEDKNDNGIEDNTIPSPLYMQDPENIETIITYDPETQNYYLSTKIGEYWYRRPKALTFEEYLKYDLSKSVDQFWYDRAKEERIQFQEGLMPGFYKRKKFLEILLGKKTLDIKAQGSAEVLFSVRTSQIDNPLIPENNRKTTIFDMDENIKFNMQGQIGNRMTLNFNYDTKATFDFDTELHLGYEGGEDDIIKNVEIGNVSFSLPGTLITGAQDLFGIKTDLQFGKLFVSSVFSQQRSEARRINLQRGAQKREFKIDGSLYEANKHFFLSKYFRDNYEKALSALPVIFSNVNIQKIEVWVTNKNSKFQDARNFVAFIDIGENNANIYNPFFTPVGTSQLPNNETNNLYALMTTSYSSARDVGQAKSILSAIPGFNQGNDYEKVESARRLSESEYTLHPKLGYISLKRQLNSDEILAVAYEYVAGGKIYRVGEFSNDGPDIPQSLYLKLVKGTSFSPKLPTWDLMMKNVYRLNVRNLSFDQFMLDVMYENDKAGGFANYIPEGNIEGIPLLSVLNLDNLNTQLDAQPDGLFDFIEGTTVDSRNGIIIFPVLEPFGDYLRKKIGDDAIADKYVYDALYELSQIAAQQIPGRNKFTLHGTLKVNVDQGNVSLDALNVPRGSVNVSAGGVQLVENHDYSVDYTTGKVQIINPSILESGTPVQITSENNALFNVQNKTMLGTHLDYRFNENFNLGATVMYMQERALYSKVNIGDEPVSNFMWGFNGAYFTESDFLTRMVNKLPFIESDATSTFDIEGEFAQLLPGHNRAIGEAGRAYLDDFEGSKRIIDLRSDRGWYLASVPQHQNLLFPEGNLINDLAHGFNRANLTWYLIDPYFYRKDAPGHIKSDVEQLSDHLVREVRETEIFPEKNIAFGSTSYTRVLNLAYFPDEKGAYNYETTGQAGISAGMNADGTLKSPGSRWGGIMKQLSVSDFETANVDYIEFWLMDPFINDPNHSGGELYFNLGNISEDILKDSRKSFENGLPTAANETKLDTTAWGVIPLVQPFTNGFDLEALEEQDLGLDGINTINEINFFGNYLQSLQSAFGAGSKTYQDASEDPSNDDYHYYRGDDYDQQELSIIERYKKFIGMENNTSSSADNLASSSSSAYRNDPDAEDINNDNTLNEAEAYYQYKVDLSPGSMQVGQNFIVDKRTATVNLRNGEKGSVDWYQFRIPISEYQETLGEISDFKSIRFIRIFLRDFDQPAVLRFARLNLVRDDWRRYNYSLFPGKEGESQTTLAEVEMGTVNIEENSRRTPVNYIQPVGIERVQDPSNPTLRFLNEQALVLKVRNLDDDDSRAIYKNFDTDLRLYKHIKMDVHAEAIDNDLQDEDLRLFIRIGSDFTDNYYEYETPLLLTPPGLYSNDSETDKLTVWPDKNRIDFDFEIFTRIKLIRNKESSGTGGVDYVNKFSRTVAELVNNNPENIFEGDVVNIKGNPSLSNVRTIMIGVRNPKEDGNTKSVEIWVNELRVSEFDNESGWAANLRASTKLADFGTVSIAGGVYTSGFGAIDHSVTERAMEDQFRYDIIGNFELGKLFPEKWGLNIPAFYSVSGKTITPKYQGLDDDIELKTALDNAATSQEADFIKDISQTVVKRKSFNLTNVGKQKKGEGKSKPWDISNFSFTYSYDEEKSHNTQIESDFQKNYRGLITYNYTMEAKPIQPFKKWGFIKNKKYLQLIRDFNINLIPSQISVRSDITRHYREIIRRNIITNADFIITPTYDKDFIWNRYYDFRIPFTKNLNFYFSAASLNRIDEPQGMVDKRRNQASYELWKEEVWDNFIHGGRTVNYNHRFSLMYKLPFNKIPILNWINAQAKYGGMYEWNSGPITADTINIGNTILNNRIIDLTGRFNLVKLYNKSKYFKKINRDTSRKRQGAKQSGKPRRVAVERSIKKLIPGKEKTVVHGLGTKNVTVKMYTRTGRPIRGFSKKINSRNKIKVSFSGQDTLSNVRVRLSGLVKRRKSDVTLGKFGDTFVRMLLILRNISATYLDERGTTLPGFLPSPKILGSRNYNGYDAPGFSFLAGLQNENFGREVVEKGFVTTDEILNEPYRMNRIQTLKIRASLEPFQGFRIDLDGHRSYNENTSEFFSFNQGTNNFNWTNKTELGNFSMSYFSLKSAFFKIGNESNYSSKYYDDFLNRRKNESLRLAKQRYGADYQNYEIIDNNNVGTGFYDGYSPTSQEVLVAAFHKAYGIKTNKLIPGLAKIMPNWHFSYDGLTKMDAVRKYVRKLNINHTYKSSYQVGSFERNLRYEEDNNGFSAVRDINNINFIPEHEADAVAISESFNPFIGIDITFENDLTAHFKMNREHNLLLNLMNSQLIETSSRDLVLGASYRINDFEIFLGRKSNLRKFKNDLNVRGDFSIRKDNQIYRNIIQETNQLTAGQKVMTLKLSADYVLNDKFNIRIFYDRVVNNPYTSISYPTLNSNFGISVRYVLSPLDKGFSF